MDIKVDVGPITLDTVIGEHRIYDSEDEEYHTEPMTLGNAVARQIFADLQREGRYTDLRREASSLRQEEIRAQLAPIVAEAITTPVQKTNAYGEPTGEPTTLRALIIAEVEQLLKKPADPHRREKGTWLASLVRTEVEAALKTELSAVLADEKAKVVAAVQAKAAELIADAVKAGIGR